MPLSRSPFEQFRSTLETTAGEAIIETLVEWGIEIVFGIPGDNVDGLVGGLVKYRDRIKFVLVRHEENAAFMAIAYAKLTGKMAACLTIAGPGAFHLYNGLFEAYHDHVPLLVLTGNVELAQLCTEQVQEFKPELTFAACTVWNGQLAAAQNARIVTSIAIRAAHARRGPALLAVPVDVGLQALPDGGKRTDHQYSPPLLMPEPAVLTLVLEALDRAKKPMLLVGRGCWGLGAPLVELAEKIGAPIVKTLWGKEAVSDFDPHVLGGLGLLGSRASVEAAVGADLLLMLGTSFPFNDYLPRPDHCSTIQIDRDPYQIGKRYPIDIGMCADVHHAVPLLLKGCNRKDNGSWLKECQKARTAWNKLMDKQGQSDRTPMRPQAVARALQDCAAEDAIICTDSGANTVWMARNFFVNGQQRFIGTGLVATMQCGLPYAIGAQLAFPGRQVLAAVGDGGFVMGMGDFLTAIKQRLPIIVTVFDNSKLALIKYEQEVAAIPEFGIHFVNPDFAKFAEACGGFGVRVEDPGDLHDAIRAAIASGKPAIIDAVVEPNEVPFPPKVERGQAVGFGLGFLREAMERIKE